MESLLCSLGTTVHTAAAIFWPIDLVPSKVSTIFTAYDSPLHTLTHVDRVDALWRGHKKAKDAKTTDADTAD